MGTGKVQLTCQPNGIAGPTLRSANLQINATSASRSLILFHTNCHIEYLKDELTPARLSDASICMGSSTHLAHPDYSELLEPWAVHRFECRGCNLTELRSM